MPANQKKGITRIEDMPMVMHTKDVAEFLRISEQRAGELLKRPGVPAVKIDGRYKIHRDKFCEWWNAQMAGEEIVLGA